MFLQKHEIPIFKPCLVRRRAWKVRIRTRGPRGPWVAHLRKRAKATVKQIIENIIGA